MAGPDFLSTHRRQRRYRNAARSRGVGAIRLVTPIMALGFLGTLAALQLPPGSFDDLPTRALSGIVEGAEIAETAETLVPPDRLTARFGFCHSGGGTNCVVDGDTFWFGGEKYRIADIDTPETHPARCAEEAALGRAATQRLQDWMNAGAFSLESAGRDTDRYGRKLRIVTRGGASVGAVLIDAGLARPWEGQRRPWC
ncbi:thermonuclease family protein [Sphingopyxis sp. KK2]|uniref:thermonuclease family protein n=1 Tax=Sphingopyxis sp. KK2 TaxID=1855727 RepID=UPI002117CB97|nr:thermonuclease family protein [Sphingopyxis sp. KK2]